MLSESPPHNVISQSEEFGRLLRLNAYKGESARDNYIRYKKNMVAGINIIVKITALKRNENTFLNIKCFSTTKQ